MKKKAISKKLKLNKEKISNLESIKGGVDILKTIDLKICDTIPGDTTEIV